MEPLCSSGAAESLLAHLCLSKDRKRQSSELQSRGGAWEGQGRASQHIGLGQGTAGLQVPAENKVCLQTASCLSHQ